MNEHFDGLRNRVIENAIYAKSEIKRDNWYSSSESEIYINWHFGPKNWSPGRWHFWIGVFGPRRFWESAFLTPSQFKWLHGKGWCVSSGGFRFNILWWHLKHHHYKMIHKHAKEMDPVLLQKLGSDQPLWSVSSSPGANLWWVIPCITYDSQLFRTVSFLPGANLFWAQPFTPLKRLFPSNDQLRARR